MKAVEGAIYCGLCAGRLAGRSHEDLRLSFPVSHKESKGTCRGCGETVDLRKAHKVIRKKKEKKSVTHIQGTKIRKNMIIESGNGT